MAVPHLLALVEKKLVQSEQPAQELSVGPL